MNFFNNKFILITIIAIILFLAITVYFFSKDSTNSYIDYNSLIINEVR